MSYFEDLANIMRDAREDAEKIQKEALEKIKKTKEKQKKLIFIEELTKLSQSHEIYIKGCGCCNSPWLDHNNKALSYELNELGDSELKIK